MSMGMAYVPGTFPTVGVYGFMTRAGVSTTWAEVDRLWDAYYLATVVEGIPPFNSKAGGKNAAPLLQYMEAKTQIPRNTIAGWLNALEQEVAANGRGYYLDPVTADKAAEGQVSVDHPLESIKTITAGVGQAAGNLLKPSLDPVTNLVKYTAIGLVSVAVIYGLFQVPKIFKKRRR